MTGAETADDAMEGNAVTQQDETADLAPVNPSSMSHVTASPLREKMRKRVAYWKSLRSLNDEQQAALEFWENYLARDQRSLAMEAKPQTDASEPLQRR